MPTLIFTPQLQRHVASPDATLAGDTVGEVLDAYFALYPRVRGYIFDDQGKLRDRLLVYVDGDPKQLSDSVTHDAKLYVMPSLSRPGP